VEVSEVPPSADIGSFIMNEASLETHIKDPPSIVSQSSSTDDSESTLDINVPTALSYDGSSLTHRLYAVDVYSSLPSFSITPPFEVHQEKFAYVSVLGWNPVANQNKVYLDSTRVMIRSLIGSTADFIVLMMYDDKNAEAQLLSEGAIVQSISPVRHSLDISYFEPWFVDIALAKLRAFEMTDYKRVQVLDVDAAIESAERLDGLFTSFPNVKLVAEGLGSESPLRAGWLMIQPSTEVFHDLQVILERGQFSSELGWDYMNLPVKYPGWKPANPNNNWEFYGSQLEQGNRVFGCICQIPFLYLTYHSFDYHIHRQDCYFTISMHYPKVKTHWSKITNFSSS
jgi:hypothetical protein